MDQNLILFLWHLLGISHNAASAGYSITERSFPIRHAVLMTFTWNDFYGRSPNASGFAAVSIVFSSPTNWVGNSVAVAPICVQIIPFPQFAFTRNEFIVVSSVTIGFALVSEGERSPTNWLVNVGTLRRALLSVNLGGGNQTNQ
jgi:hypothetical protein